MYFIISKRHLTVHLDIRTSFGFTYFNIIEHGTVSKIPQYYFYRMNTNIDKDTMPGRERDRWEKKL